jgi:putative acetyltransferase
MSFEIVMLSEGLFEPLHGVLDMVAREKRFLAFTEAPPLEEARDFYRGIVAGDHVMSVALMEGQVIGWCDALPTRGQARAHLATLGMGLLPAYRHRGLGFKLLQHTMCRAWLAGFSKIELTVRTDNTNAKALYERAGFQTEGLLRRAFRVDGEYYDAYSMAALHDGVAPPPFNRTCLRQAG